MGVRFATLAILALTAGAADQPERGRPADSLLSAGLSQSETREIVASVEQLAYDTPDAWDAELRVKRVDLGASRGVVVQGTALLCGATGNCQLFVLRNVSGHWTSLFDMDQAPIADGFEFGPGATNGIKDLTITSHISAGATRRVTYHFDGRFYRAK